MIPATRFARRSFLSRTALGAALLGVPALAPALAKASGEPWSIVVLPDTQFYVRYDGPSHRPKMFARQTEWIADNLASENIVFVSHVGDVVNNGNEQAIEWERANAAMNTLHGLVPYSVVPGNHDLEKPGSRASGMATFVQHYGAARYSGMPWYGGCSKNQANHYQLFQAGDWTFLHLGLELEALDSALHWAQSVLDGHAGLPTIVTTHLYQNDTRGRTQADEFQGNCGEQIWRKSITSNPQIIMVLNGHFYASDGERHQISHNSARQPVFEMISDYQNRPDGGGGYLRIIRFDPSANTISVRSYSPWLDKSFTDADSAFSFSVDFAERFGPPSGPIISTGTTPTDGSSRDLSQRVFLPLAQR